MGKLLRFALVGGSGAVLNLGVFFLLVDREGLDPTGAAVMCFALAVTSNYVLNHAWTFHAQIESEKPSVGRYVRFVAVSLAGLGVNVGILNLVLALFHPVCKVLGQAAGIACGMMVNYTGSNLFAFRRKMQRRQS
jgi:putative flippase GtrA